MPRNMLSTAGRSALPRSPGAFACAAPLLVLMSVFTALISVGEVMLFGFLGRIVDRLSAAVPLIARVYPNGGADVNHFHAAGGMGYVIRELLDAGLAHGDVLTVFLAAKQHHPKVPLLSLFWFHSAMRPGMIPAWQKHMVWLLEPSWFPPPPRPTYVPVLYESTALPGVVGICVLLHSRSGNIQQDT